MTLDKQFKLEKACCEKSSTRYLLTEPHLDVENNVMVATNGRLMAIVPVTELFPADVSGHVSNESLVAARKLDKHNPNLTIECNGALKLTNGATLLRPELGKYPNYRQCLPNANRPVGFKIALNPKLLLALCEAIGYTNNGKSQSCVLEFEDDKSPIKVTGATSGAIGVLMPMKAT